MRLNSLSKGIDIAVLECGGTVCSVFQQACNVSHENGMLLTVITADIANLPQGIRIENPPGFSFLDYARPGQRVICSGGIMRFDRSVLSVDLRTARVWHRNLCDLCLDLRQEAIARAWSVVWTELLRHQHCAVPDAALGFHTLLEPTTVGSATQIILVRRAARGIDSLLQATRDLHVHAATRAIGPLIGLGAGLTPSGDDFLVGYLAGLWSSIMRVPSRLAFIASLGKGLLRVVQRTNDISGAFLKSAIKGHFAEILATLAQGIAEGRDLENLRNATRAALAVGSSSGFDGVLGLLLGCTVWTPQHRQPQIVTVQAGLSRLALGDFVTVGLGSSGS